MIPWPGTQALVVSRADKIFISALLASSRVRSNIYPCVDEACYANIPCIFPPWLEETAQMTSTTLRTSSATHFRIVCGSLRSHIELRT